MASSARRVVLGLAWAAAAPLHAQSDADLDRGLRQLVADYTRLYTKDSLPRWRALFLPTFTAANTTPDLVVRMRRLDEFYAAQERGFREAANVGERLENVRIERRGRMATISADFVYWHDDPGRRGWLVLTAIWQAEGWRFNSLMFSYQE